MSLTHKNKATYILQGIISNKKTGSGTSRPFAVRNYYVICSQRALRMQSAVNSLSHSACHEKIHLSRKIFNDEGV